MWYGVCGLVCGVLCALWCGVCSVVLRRVVCGVIQGHHCHKRGSDKSILQHCPANVAYTSVFQEYTSLCQESHKYLAGVSCKSAEQECHTSVKRKCIAK